MERLDFFSRYSAGVEAKPSGKKSPINIQRLAEEIGGRIVSRGMSDIIVVEKIVPQKTLHGEVRIQGISGIDESFLRTVFYSSFNNLGFNIPEKINPEELLFMDIETTGLSAGAGTLAFLLGLAVVDNDGIRVKQYFLPSFGAERLFIEELKKALFSKRFLVTYNGKSFDYHIIRNRFVMQGHQFDDDFHLHFDLLYPARRFWRGLLEQYSLINVEQRILRVNRNSDIPGSEVPVLYFKYINSGDVRPVKKIVYHNRMDVLSLVALLIRMKELVEACTVESENRPGIIFNTCSVAGYFLKCGMMKKARKILELHGTSPHELFRLGLVYKKEGLYSKAISTFSSCMEKSRDAIIFVSGCVEIAKIYEHRFKDYRRALMYTEKAIIRVERSRVFYPEDELLLDKIYQELKRRYRRLLRKLNR